MSGREIWWDADGRLQGERVGHSRDVAGGRDHRDFTGDSMRVVVDNWVEGLHFLSIAPGALTYAQDARRTPPLRVTLAIWRAIRSAPPRPISLDSTFYQAIRPEHANRDDTPARPAQGERRRARRAPVCGRALAAHAHVDPSRAVLRPPKLFGTTTKREIRLQKLMDFLSRL